MEPLVVSVAEACRMLGIGRTTAYTFIGLQKLEVCKLGRRTLIKVASIHKLIEDQS